MNHKIALINNLAVLLICFICLVSCDNNTVYHTYHHIPEGKWKKSDTLSYNIQGIIETGMYQLSVEVRNDARYPYTDLHLYIQHNIPDTCTFVIDTLQCPLVNEDEKWSGVGWGTLYQSSFTYKDLNIKYPKAKYTINIFHRMKDYSLTGINDIGIRIRKI